MSTNQELLERMSSALGAPLSILADGFVGFATPLGMHIAPIDGDGFVVYQDTEVLLESRDIDECVQCARERTDRPFHAAYWTDAEATEETWAEVVGRWLGAEVSDFRSAVWPCNDFAWLIVSWDKTVELGVSDASTFRTPEIEVRRRDGREGRTVVFKSTDLDAVARFASSINSSGYQLVEGPGRDQ